MAHLIGSIGSISQDSISSTMAGSIPPGAYDGALPSAAAATNTTTTTDGLDAARHLCQEARVVLTSLRGGPPNVARGDLAQDLMDLRQLVKQCLVDPSLLSSIPTAASNQHQHHQHVGSAMFNQQPTAMSPAMGDHSVMSPTGGHGMPPMSPNDDPQSATAATPSTSGATDDEEILDEDGAVLVQQREAVHLQQSAAAAFNQQDPHMPHSQPQPPPALQLPHHYTAGAFPPSPSQSPQDIGAFARPFLSVILDPRAAGPHTLVALRALYRLLERSSLQPSKHMLRRQTSTASTASVKSSASKTSSQSLCFPVELEPLTRGVLNCKFEQTDAGADEAVEMAIADLLALLVRLDRRSLHPATLMDAFNTVFITRNTFVHSPALCYHFEDVLTSMIVSVFSDIQDRNQRDVAGRLILEFLSNQLLHTPMLGGDDEASRDAQLAHDATRVLCLRLARCALRHAFAHADDGVLQAAAKYGLGSATAADAQDVTAASANAGKASTVATGEDRSLLQIVQDDLCIALLMTGQAIWMNQDNPSVSPGFISLEVLSEICSTLSMLWTTVPLRKYLVSQFETIFTGFYQRALALLRKRTVPNDSLTFHANVVFDAGIEVILESLVDILCLHDHKHNIVQGNGGTIESLFMTYDCNLKRSDVAIDLFMELCRCSGSSVDEEGDQLEPSVHGDVEVPTDKTVARALQSGTASVAATSAAPNAATSNASAPPGLHVNTEGLGASQPADQLRQVPPHLKELCAEAIIGAMKCMFQDDHPSEQTRIERMDRKSILPDHVEGDTPSSLSQVEQLKKAQCSHQLRHIKAQKRLMRRAAQLFNKKASKGIAFLVSSGLIPDPPTPRSVASFLRNGIVVGLDKKAVGAYLGEEGKKPMSGKSPPNWERDWFHKEALEEYCSLFRFEGQSLLDGLRMFLAAFRLPGESQQIDRILQNFADSCVKACEETHQGLFSKDPKRASDAAYLLSFSIIMLNTDRHNENIREDRKMSKQAFVRNNTDYGRDIMEKGEEFPQEYLEAIYDSIRMEEIRTEGEGADGCMTLERWKDVIRGSTDEASCEDILPSEHDAEDLAELVLEHVWMPIMSAVAALWNVSKSQESNLALSPTNDAAPSGMLGAQGSRLGMDMALEMLLGVRKLARNDIFRKIFKCVCHFSGLLEYNADLAQRTWTFSNSVESQSAFLAAFKMAREAGDEIGEEGWKMIWSILFELRDLKMLGGGVATRARSILMESDPDLLREDARRDWTMKMLKGGREDAVVEDTSAMGVTSIFGSVGRALFGSVEDPPPTESADATSRPASERTIHGKEDLYVWDDLAPSDDEDEGEDAEESEFLMQSAGRMTIGSQFESQLIHEDMLIQQRRQTPVTGLERVEDSQRLMLSPRARSRKRLARACNLSTIVSDTRFMDVDGINNVLYSLISLIQGATAQRATRTQPDEGSEIKIPTPVGTPVSPASEAFAEVLICEIALRNRDRLSMLWQKHLRQHYVSRLESLCRVIPEAEQANAIAMDAGLEKCVTGLLRICCCAVQREGGISSDVLSVFTMLDPSKEQEGATMLSVSALDGHLGEGLWRIARNIDAATKLSTHGWDGLLCLAAWCAYRGSLLKPIQSGIGQPVGLAESDPALQAYRTLHYIINVSEVKDEVPPGVIGSIRMLIIAGDRRRCPKLAIAALDVLQAVNAKIGFSDSKESRNVHDGVWKSCWRPVLDVLGESAELNSYASVRQHSLSILADCFLDKRGSNIPVPHLCSALVELCIPLAGRRLVHMRQNAQGAAESFDELMIELELCISLIFKPLRHHVKMVANEESTALLALWKSVLAVLEQLLSNQLQQQTDSANTPAARVTKATTDLALEHLRNVVLVLIDFNLLLGNNTNEISALTWTSLEQFDACKPHMEEWKAAAASASS
mmetsp:Transcript_12541/g.36478  ORF Transcript_12541/g.36478 Transcript_12541/m.36478 type:complete len:1902 (-) Transcript_12541:119-5824(-)